MYKIPGLLVCFLLMYYNANADFPQLRGRDKNRQEELRPRLKKIRDRHPRIFCGAEELAEIRHRAKTTPEIREVYGWLMEWARGKQFYRNLWATPNQLMAACVAYRLSEEKNVLTHSISIADYLAEAEGDSWTLPRIAKGLAFAFDWLYDDLTSEQRRRYGLASLRAAKDCYKTWRHSDFNNHQYLEYGPILYPGIALYKEGIDDSVAEQLALDGLNLLLDHFMPAHEIVAKGDGGWHESMGYHAFFTYEFAHLIELWSKATGEDIWADYTGLDGEAAWLIYCSRPFDEGRVSVADLGSHDSFSLSNAQYLVLLQRRHKDGLARYLTDRIKSEAVRRHEAGIKYSRDGSSWWQYVLWYDPTVPEVIREELPTTRLFRGLGWCSIRSDWTPDATFALFICSPLWLGGHQHADNNSFIIHKSGLLALDSGVYEGTAHRANYYARTIAHNSITIFDPSEQFNGGTWGSGRPGEGSNDGGQMFTHGPLRVWDIEPGGKYHRGKIISYESNSDFTYVVGDATRSYSAEKIKEFTRAFLYLRPNIFVIFDRVESAKADFVKRWLLHSAYEPELKEAEAQISTGKAKLGIWTIFPRNPQLKKIGGPGREFEVNGRNYPPEKEYDANEAGRWRIEVTHKEKAMRQYFLHLLITQDSESDFDVSAKLIESDGKIGINIRTSQAITKAIFTKKGDLIGELEMSDSTGELYRRRFVPKKVNRLTIDD